MLRAPVETFRVKRDIWLFTLIMTVALTCLAGYFYSMIGRSSMFIVLAFVLLLLGSLLLWILFGTTYQITCSHLAVRMGPLSQRIAISDMRDPPAPSESQTPRSISRRIRDALHGCRSLSLDTVAIYTNDSPNPRLRISPADQSGFQEQLKRAREATSPGMLSAEKDRITALLEELGHDMLPYENRTKIEKVLDDLIRPDAASCAALRVLLILEGCTLEPAVRSLLMREFCGISAPAGGRHFVTAEHRQELLAEHSGVRSEITTRMTIRDRVLIFALVAAATFMTLSLDHETVQQPALLLSFPILSFFLALEWLHCDVRIGELGRYIRTEIEPLLPGLSWEGYPIDDPPLFKALRFRVAVISALGVFAGVGVLSVVTAQWAPAADTTFKDLWTALDVVLVLVTSFALFTRKKQIEVG